MLVCQHSSCIFIILVNIALRVAFVQKRHWCEPSVTSVLCCSYHQKVPPVAPDLELKATFGLAAPEEFKLPEPNAQWTADVYKAFEITKMPSRNEVCYQVANCKCYDCYKSEQVFACERSRLWIHFCRFSYHKNQIEPLSHCNLARLFPSWQRSCDICFYPHENRAMTFRPLCDSCAFHGIPIICSVRDGNPHHCVNCGKWLYNADI